MTPAMLLILDGIGYREETEHNAFAHAKKPNWDRLWREFPHGIVNASESFVGLPAEQMGNSEVGHLNIGAGRVVYQELSRVDVAIESGEFFENPALKQAIEAAKKTGKALHVLGLLSPGGVHSHEAHIFALIEMAARMGMKNILVHAFLDGRDTPPKSAAASLAKLQHKLDSVGCGKIASLCGRYWAMDRDKRWDRVQAAYDLIAEGRAEFHSSDAAQALSDAYSRGETDEFVKPVALSDAKMEDGDAVVFMNFRADRAREITSAIAFADFSGFERGRVPRLSSFVTLTHYGDEFSGLATAFPPTKIDNCLGEYLSGLGLRQLRIAETEKYAHVTYFLNGGREEPYPLEDRVLVPSPKVATYDLQPEMSAFEVTERLVEAIESGNYQAIICNYANGDMVGHTGNFEAAVRAVEALDRCLGKVVETMRKAGGEVLITADHGNAEMMVDSGTRQPHTAHTLNLVPFLYVGRPARIIEGGSLRDVAPSMLAIMGLRLPEEMTGRSLISFE